MSVCYDGHTFFLGFPTWKGEVGDFYPLPGGTNGDLDGKQWGGLTIEDMVIRYVLACRSLYTSNSCLTSIPKAPTKAGV